MLSKNKLVNILENLDACDDSLEWLSGVNSLQQAWDECKRGDWMLWILANLKADRKKVILSACGCARLSLRFSSDEKVVHAIEAAEAWTRDEATLADLDRAAVGAEAAEGAAVDAAAEAAAGAAVEAARCAARTEAAAEAGAQAWAAVGAEAWAAVEAARCVWAAAEAARCAAEAGAAAEAWEDTQKQCADIIRLYFSLEEASVLVNQVNFKDW